MFDTLEFVLSSPNFRAGLPAAGVILFTAVILFPARRRLPTLPIGGLALAAGGLASLSNTPIVSREILAALAISAAGGLVADVFRLPIPVCLVLAAPGAWLVSQAVGDPLPAWVAPTVFVTLTVAGPLLARFDRDQDCPPLGPTFLALAIGGAFLTLPDTEEILVLLPIAAAAALGGWPLRTLRLGAGGSFASLGLLAAVAAWDGRGRVASIVGVIVTLTVPLVWILVTSVVRNARPATTRFRACTLTLIHLVVVLFASRVVGLRDSVEMASILGAATAVVVAGILPVLALAWSAPE
jgi:hypothetical protein